MKLVAFVVEVKAYGCCNIGGPVLLAGWLLNAPSNMKTEESCVISDTCWRRMTSFGYSLYSLSHEIFYLQIGERWGCLPDILFRIRLNGQGGLRELQDTFCANLMREAIWIVQQGYPASHQDLFMEQAVLCGLYGYLEFFKNDWLDRILSWQDITTGCYRSADWPRISLGEARSHHVEKREERRLDNGCLCHRTTVAAAALVQYVRFLVEDYLDQANTREAQTA